MAYGASNILITLEIYVVFLFYRWFIRVVKVANIQSEILQDKPLYAPQIYYLQFIYYIFFLSLISKSFSKASKIYCFEQQLIALGPDQNLQYCF